MRGATSDVIDSTVVVVLSRDNCSQYVYEANLPVKGNYQAALGTSLCLEKQYSKKPTYNLNLPV